MAMFDIDSETTEIRLLRSIIELNARIMMAPTLERRTLLRGTAHALRTELLNLIQQIQIPDESDVAMAGGAYVPSPKMRGSS